VEFGQERERREIGYSESISAHATTTTTKNRGHDRQDRCMRSESQARHAQVKAFRAAVRKT